MVFSALDALATICTAELQSEEQNATAKRKRKALDAPHFEEPGFEVPIDVVSMRGFPGLTSVGLTPEPRLPGSAAFAQIGIGSAQRHSRPAFVSEPGAPLLPLAPASAQKLATPLLRVPPSAAAAPLSDVWMLPAAKRRGVLSAGGMPLMLPLGLVAGGATRSPTDSRPIAPHPLETPGTLGRTLGLPERTPLAGRPQPQPMRALSPSGAAWQHPAPLRVSPTGSGASDGPCSLTGGAALSGAAAAARPTSDRHARSPPYSPSPSPSAAGADSESEQQLLEDPVACVSRIVQSPSKGGPGLLEKMKLAQVLLTHRDALNPEQVKMVVEHLSSVLQSADAQQLARQAAAQQQRHHYHHQEHADAGHQAARQPASERRLSAAAGCGEVNSSRHGACAPLPAKVSDEAMTAAAVGLMNAGDGPTRGAASSSSSHTHGGDHSEHPRATASSAPAAAASGRMHPLALHQAALRLQSLQRCGSHEDDEATQGLAGAGCGGVAGGLLHSNSIECNNNADGGIDVASLGTLLPPRFDSSAASGISSLQSRPPRRSSSELLMHPNAQQQLLHTPSMPSSAATLSPHLLLQQQQRAPLPGAAWPRHCSQGLEPSAHRQHDGASQADGLLAALAERAAASGKATCGAAAYDVRDSAAVLQRLQSQHAHLRARPFQAEAQPPRHYQQHHHLRQQHLPLHGGVTPPAPQLHHALRWGAREAAPAPPALALLTAAQLQHARRGGVAATGVGAAGSGDGYVVVSRQGGDHRGGVRDARLGAPEGFGDSKAALAAAGLGHMLRH